MATLTTTIVGNILDVLKFKAPNGSPMEKPVNTLCEIDDFTRDMPALPANAGLTHHGLRTVQLPTGYIVDIGGSWKSSKAVHEPFVEALMTLRSSYEATIDTYKNEPKAVGQAQLEADLDAHLHALSQGMMNIILEGTSVPNMSAVVGLMKRPPYTTYDNKFCFNLGGASDSTDLRSAWLIKPGIDTVHALYNGNHPTLGIEQEEMPITRKDGLGTGGDEHNWIMTIENMITRGICVRDMTACKRLCNIPCGTADYPGEDVCNMAIEASIINATKQPGKTNGLANASVVMNTWMLYCDERLYAKLVRSVNDRIQVERSEDNIFQTKLPMIGDNIIVRRLDALNHEIGSGETYVVAA